MSAVFPNPIIKANQHEIREGHLTLANDHISRSKPKGLSNEPLQHQDSRNQSKKAILLQVTMSLKTIKSASILRTKSYQSIRAPIVF